MSTIFSAFMDGFTGGDLLTRIRRPGAPTQVFADENSTQPQTELLASLFQRQAQHVARPTNETATISPNETVLPIPVKDWGRLDDAMALLKQQEALCVELGDKAGLQVCYGNQALILKDWGRLDDAMALLKQQEALCVELGDKDGLLRNCSNQAMIVLEWGDNARALLKHQEALCMALGTRPNSSEATATGLKRETHGVPR